MLKAIFWKELRELLIVIVAAALVYGLIVVGIQRTTRLGPDHLRGLAWLFIQISVLLTLAVGIWQNQAEKKHETILFLFHRPARREAILVAKLLAGACICFLICIAPLLTFTTWAMQTVFLRRPEDSLWRLAAPVCAGVVLVYLGAFMSSLREARWYRSKFLPLLAGLGLFLALLILANTWTLLVLTALLVLVPLFVAATLYQAMTQSYS